MVLVSVICNAYNQEMYIKDALDSFLFQKTSFPFEVLIHDDASTDSTADIIHEYALKHPEIIKPIFETENIYSKHDGSLSRLQYSRVNGKYIAVCEGDDYWIDPLKLQKQFDAMEQHPELDMCAHAAYRVDAKDNRVLNMISPSSVERVLSIDEVILGDGGYLSTNSLFYRAELNKSENLPGFRKLLDLDYSVQIHGAMRGGILFLPEVMSVYRTNVPGSWTSKQTQKSKIIEINKSKNAMLFELDVNTDFKYTETIKKRLLINEYKEHIKLDDGRAALNKKYKELFAAEPLRNKIRILIKALFPHLIKLYRLKG